MENLLLNFDLISTQIFCDLATLQLSYCRLVSKSWKNFIDSSKFYNLRVLRRQFEKPQKWLAMRKDWKLILRQLELKGKPQEVVTMGNLLREFELSPFCIELATPLHLAAFKGNLEDLEFLHQKLKFLSPKDRNGRLPIHYATLNSQISSINVILSYYQEEERQQYDNFGLTPLHISASVGNLAVFKRLLDETTDKNPVNVITGDTPLHLAVLEGHKEIVEIILLSLERLKNPENYEGWTPLHISLLSGSVLMTREILMHNSRECEANPAENENGLTPLHLAAIHGRCRIAKIISEYLGSEEKSPENEMGMTPLHFAARFGHFSTFSFLSEKVLDTNPLDYLNRTTLHLAAKFGHFDLVQFIFSKMQEKNPRDLTGRTPIHFAAAKGHLQIVQYLAEKNSKPFVRDFDGLTPLHYAHANHHFKVVDYIIKFKSSQKHQNNMIINKKNLRFTICKLSLCLINKIMEKLMEFDLSKEMKDVENFELKVDKVYKMLEELTCDDKSKVKEAEAKIDKFLAENKAEEVHLKNERTIINEDPKELEAKKANECKEMGNEAFRKGQLRILDHF